MIAKIRMSKNFRVLLFTEKLSYASFRNLSENTLIIREIIHIPVLS